MKGLTDGAASAFRQLEITFDRVFVAIDLRDAIVKPARTFARIAHSINLLRAANFSDERAAQQPLEIQSKVGTEFSRFRQPRPQTPRCSEPAKFAAWKKWI